MLLNEKLIKCWNEPVITLVDIAKILAIHNSKSVIGINELLNAISFLDLNDKATDLFRQTIGDIIDEIEKRSRNVIKTLLEETKVNTIKYEDEKFEVFIHQLYEYFGNESILRIT